MYKLIACDLDETLLNDKKEVGKRNIEAIKKAEQEYGVRFVPATGRGYTCLDSILTDLDVLNKENEYVISINGGIISENKNLRELSFHHLPFEKTKELFEFGMKKGVCMQVFTAKDVYAFNIDEDEMKWLLSFKPDSILCKEKDIEFLKNDKIAKILFQKADMEYLTRLAEEMRPLTDGCVSVSFSSHRYLELNQIGVDKGVGLRELAAHLNIDMSETIAIGDNFNDVAMLKEAGLSIAVANALPEIKEICDYVTVADNNQGAVAEAIEKFIFNNQV